MSSSLMIAQMGAAEGSEIQVFKFKYSGNWRVIVEGHNDGIAFKIEGAGQSFADAVAECHQRWSKVTGLMPELIGLLPSPSPTEYQDADYMIHQPLTDDDIPF